MTPEEAGQAIKEKAQEILDIMQAPGEPPVITYCVWCKLSGMTDAQAREHLATCEKHPAVIRLAERERGIRRAVDLLRQKPVFWFGAVPLALEILAKPEAPDAH